jgi:hypothetical protein
MALRALPCLGEMALWRFLGRSGKEHPATFCHDRSSALFPQFQQQFNPPINSSPAGNLHVKALHQSENKTAKNHRLSHPCPCHSLARGNFLLTTAVSTSMRWHELDMHCSSTFCYAAGKDPTKSLFIIWVTVFFESLSSPTSGSGILSLTSTSFSSLVVQLLYSIISRR